MRGSKHEQGEMLSALTPDDLVPADHPIRRIRVIVDGALEELHSEFDAMYSRVGRPSIAPERLLKASLLIALYSVRSERQFCERLQYDLMFKWFLNMNIGDASFDPTTFSKNRERLLDHEVAHRFFEAVRGEAERRRLLSDDHFTVDGTLLEAWASVKSVRPNDDENAPPTGRNPDVDFHGQQRRNDTHQSTTDPEALLARKSKGTAAKPSYAGHVLMENRNGLVVGAALTQADGYAERATALRLLQDHRGRRLSRRRWTVGGDKAFDTKGFVAGVRELGATPHVAQNVSGWRRSAIDERTTRHSGYALSQRVRKRVEEIFGWEKTVGGGRKLRYLGQRRNEMWMLLTVSAYNLVRMANLELTGA